MNKKVLGLFIVIFAGMLLLGFSASIFADLPPSVNSRWAFTPPNIDGTLASGEWSNATVINFTLPMRIGTGSPVEILNGTLLVENNGTYLFLAVQIYNVVYLDQDGGGNYSQLFVCFSNNDSSAIVQGDQGEGVVMWTGSDFRTHNDLYYTGSYWDCDFHAGKTDDGKLAWNHTDPIHGHVGNFTFEMAIPLVGSDTGYDFNITSLPKEIGFKIWYQEPANLLSAVFPDNLIQNAYNQAKNGSSYGDIIIHPLYWLTVITTIGGTTSPIPGNYSYSYGSNATVQAIPNVGYTFGHWELDTVNVGSTNPYSVTMYQNHTIKAFFTQIPTPAAPVGGISFYSLAPHASTPLIAYSTLFGLATAGIVVSRRRKRK